MCQTLTSYIQNPSRGYFISLKNDPNHQGKWFFTVDDDTHSSVLLKEALYMGIKRLTLRYRLTTQSTTLITRCEKSAFACHQYYALGIKPLYVISFFTRCDVAVCYWHDYFISSSLIDSILDLIFLLYHINCIIVVSMLLAVLQEVIALYFLNDYYLIWSSLIDFFTCLDLYTVSYDLFACLWAVY